MRRPKDCEEVNGIVLQRSPRCGNAIAITKKYAVNRCIVEGNARGWGKCICRLAEENQSK
jgi:hypothetical protein